MKCASFLCVLILAVCAGCSPKARTPQSLVGKSEAEVVSLLGKPASRTEWVLPQPGFGPKPHDLPPGTRFADLQFDDIDGQSWHVLLVDRETFARKTGKAPGGGGPFVIEVAPVPKGAVF